MIARKIKTIWRLVRFLGQSHLLHKLPSLLKPLDTENSNGEDLDFYRIILAGPEVTTFRTLGTTNQIAIYGFRCYGARDVMQEFASRFERIGCKVELYRDNPTIDELEMVRKYSDPDFNPRMIKDSK